ncbi:MAG: hypothetical protein KQJ78_22565 [Deltaproteobacteria bacterium]|nr:hypothetical protein [Deltaproteobacteria bacterium]
MPNSDPHVCARCHVQGGGCCRLGHPDDQTKMFGLTPGEIAGITEATGLAPSDFLIHDQAAPDFLAFLDQIHPIFRRLMPGGQRRRLRVDATGRCHFLGPAGCRLPRDARPLYCRLYPIWFTPDDRLMVLISAHCLAQTDARSWREVLARLGHDEAHFRELFAQLSQLAGSDPA